MTSGDDRRRRVRRGPCRARPGDAVGDGPDGASLEARANASEFAADVTFEGEPQDPVPLLSCGDLFLLPSSQESFGGAALEAMACEVPVVASRIGGLPELIEDGRTGSNEDNGRAGTQVPSSPVCPL